MMFGIIAWSHIARALGQENRHLHRVRPILRHPIAVSLNGRRRFVRFRVGIRGEKGLDGCLNVLREIAPRVCDLDKRCVNRRQSGTLRVLSLQPICSQALWALQKVVMGRHVECGRATHSIPAASTRCVAFGPRGPKGDALMAGHCRRCAAPRSGPSGLRRSDDAGRSNRSLPVR